MRRARSASRGTTSRVFAAARTDLCRIPSGWFAIWRSSPGRTAHPNGIGENQKYQAVILPPRNMVADVPVIFELIGPFDCQRSDKDNDNLNRLRLRVSNAPSTEETLHAHQSARHQQRIPSQRRHAHRFEDRPQGQADLLQSAVCGCRGFHRGRTDQSTAQHRAPSRHAAGGIRESLGHAEGRQAVGGRREEPPQER